MGIKNTDQILFKPLICQSLSVKYLDSLIFFKIIYYYLKKIQLKGIAIGKSHCIAWCTEGGCYTWGDCSEGKLGHSVTLS